LQKILQAMLQGLFARREMQRVLWGVWRSEGELCLNGTMQVSVNYSLGIIA
jgi:hypothetical protein